MYPLSVTASSRPLCREPLGSPMAATSEKKGVKIMLTLKQLVIDATATNEKEKETRLMENH